MRFIQKFFESKKSVEEFIEENGMEAAVKEYGLNKLVMYKLLFQYEGTELYHDEYYAGQRVYNKEGKLLGLTSHLLSLHYKKFGHFFGPCQNGNIILSQNSENQQGRTYGVFNKIGNQIIKYGKYPEFCLLPNGVALMNKSGEYGAVTVHIDGTVKTQLFIYIDRDYKNGGYELHRKEHGKIKVYNTNEAIVAAMVDSSTEIVTTEKGIE